MLNGKCNQRQRGNCNRPIVHILLTYIYFQLLIFLLISYGCTNILKIEEQTVNGCISCHSKERVLPESHAPIDGLLLEQCLGCHNEDETKLTNKIPLSHTHRLNGISCADCHGERTPPQKIGSKACGVCHDIVNLVEQTKTVAEANPHDSHYGSELTCNLCHHIHSKSENFCRECHDFQFIVPSPWIALRMNKKRT